MPKENSKLKKIYQNPIKHFRVKAFTLIEVTVAITLLALLASTTAFYLKKVSDSYLFRREISKFVADLSSIQLYSLSRQSDFSIFFHKDKEGWSYGVLSDEPGLNKLIKKRVKLKKLKEVKIGKVPVRSIEFRCCTSGRITPKEPIFFSMAPSSSADDFVLDTQRINLTLIDVNSN